MLLAVVVLGGLAGETPEAWLRANEERNTCYAGIAPLAEARPHVPSRPPKAWRGEGHFDPKDRDSYALYLDDTLFDSLNADQSKLTECASASGGDVLYILLTLSAHGGWKRRMIVSMRDDRESQQCVDRVVDGWRFFETTEDWAAVVRVARDRVSWPCTLGPAPEEERPSHPLSETSRAHCAIKRTLRDNWDAFEKCFVEHCRSKPCTEEHMTASFHVNELGTASDILVFGERNASDEAVACIVGVLKGLSFPEPRLGRKFEIAQRFSATTPVFMLCDESDDR